jgi:hypothetical protein
MAGGRLLNCQPEQSDLNEFLAVALPLSSFPFKKPEFQSLRMADHLVPNQVLGFFEFFRERERGKFSVFKGLQKLLSAQFNKIEDAPSAAYGFSHRDESSDKLVRKFARAK